jgi:cytochrome c oxidase subunit IV
MSHETSTTRGTLFRVYFGLLALLGLTAFSTRLPAGPWSLPLALTIAFVKLGLIFFYFMQLRRHRGLLWIFAAAGFFWLAIALTLTFTDYLTRG